MIRPGDSSCLSCLSEPFIDGVCVEIGKAVVSPLSSSISIAKQLVTVTCALSDKGLQRPFNSKKFLAPTMTCKMLSAACQTPRY